jgi:3-oxoacyl-[acyl-carrier-protein] synthase III
MCPAVDVQSACASWLFGLDMGVRLVATGVRNVLVIGAGAAGLTAAYELLKMWIAGGVWFAALAGIVTGSLAMDATLSTSALFVTAWAAPAVVVLLLGLGAPPPTVAELLHTVHSGTDGRS